MKSTIEFLRVTDFPKIKRETLTTLQVNLGYRCNQSCVHCHVNAGPTRTEVMSVEIIDLVIQFLHLSAIQNLDITGGAPELHPRFEYLVTAAREKNVNVIDRCNLTILDDVDYAHIAPFLAQHQVEIIASLPCYLDENVDRQRGKGVYEKSIRVLQRLNQLGYAQAATSLKLNLVYNPQGPVLPPNQHQLEQQYRRHLDERWGISFNRLYTIANMPINRFGSMLLSQGQFHTYMKLLRDAHDAANIEKLMCRSLISVDWQGYVSDCDFNQMLGIPLSLNGRQRTHLSQLFDQELCGNPIAIADHCYGCTAGQGSSCQGALN